jgi:predicted nucleotidyltransferase
MMSISFEQLLNAKSVKRIIEDLREASSNLDIEFFAVGALARNVWYMENKEDARGTKDVDFGVYVPNHQIYQSLKDMLIANFGYNEISTNAFCLISPYEKLPVDLLPFGEIENQGKVITEGSGLVSINLDGFSEVYEHGLLSKLIEGVKLSICSIPSVVLLKLIAYDDRPDNRPKDPLDINSIFIYYPDIESEKLWGEYNFLYDDEKTHDEVGISVLGYEISKIIFSNDTLIERVISILDKAINSESQLAEKMIQNPVEETVKSKQDMLVFLRNGIVSGLEKYGAE